MAPIVMVKDRLQTRVPRPDSGCELRSLPFFQSVSLHDFKVIGFFRPGGEIGRRKGLKIPR